MMRRPDWVPDGELDRKVGLMIAAALHQRLERWPLTDPVPAQCAYARATGAAARELLFEYGAETYTLLPTLAYLDLLALTLADEQDPVLEEHRRAVDLVADRLAAAAGVDATDAEGRLRHLQWAENGLEQIVRLPGWRPAAADREAARALSRLVGRRLADWPYGLGLDEQCAYAAALAAETADLVGTDVDDPGGDLARIVDFLRELARAYAERSTGREPSLGQYRVGAARLAARLLVAAGPGEHQ